MSAAPGLVSIIIVNWNGRADLQESVESALGQSYSPTEVIVVDNASTDGSREWLRAHSRGRFTLVELDRNHGFAGGVNAGISVARGETIALLNNDAAAEKDWIDWLRKPLGDRRVGMVASKILFYERRDTIDKVGHLLYPDGLNRGRGAGEVDRCQYDGERDTFFPDGCAALYRRVMLEDVGLFDEEFFAYGDDAELGIRARWKGWNCAFEPRARVYHRHSRSLGKYSPKKAFLVERNRIWVAAKLFPWPLLLLTPLLTLWRFLWHILSILASRGLAGGVAREHGAWELFATAFRAYGAGVRGLPSMFAKRREVFRTRVLSSREFYSLLWRYRISARELAFRD